MQKVTPCLWFEYNAEEAVKFYISVFPNSKIRRIIPYSEAGPGKPGSPMLIEFTLNGQEFSALNGGPWEKFTAAISLVAPCDNQQELDQIWQKLLTGGKAEQCGWLRDKYGIAWQVVPTAVLEMIADKNPAKAKAVSETMYKMIKLDVAALKQAHEKA